MTFLSIESMRRCVAPLFLLAALGLAGCGGGDVETQTAESGEAAVEAVALTPEQDALVQKAAAVANAVADAPETADQVLADNGLTADEFRTLVYRISADPVMARAYEEARKR